MDVVMPKQDGVAACWYIVDLLPATRALVLTPRSPLTPIRPQPHPNRLPM